MFLDSIKYFVNDYKLYITQNYSVASGGRLVLFQHTYVLPWQTAFHFYFLWKKASYIYIILKVTSLLYQWNLRLDSCFRNLEKEKKIFFFENLENFFLKIYSLFWNRIRKKKMLESSSKDEAKFNISEGRWPWAKFAFRYPWNPTQRFFFWTSFLSEVNLLIIVIYNYNSIYNSNWQNSKEINFHFNFIN